MNELIENLINGNLEDAKRLASGYKQWAIREALVEYGYTVNQANLTADWLKGRDCWQAACDAL